MIQQMGFHVLMLIYTHVIPEYEFSETPHRTATPSNTQIDTRLQVCIISTAKFDLRKINAKILLTLEISVHFLFTSSRDFLARSDWSRHADVVAKN